MNQSFIEQKEALLKEYQKLEKEAKAAFEKVNQLYANRIIDVMKRHGVTMSRPLNALRRKR